MTTVVTKDKSKKSLQYLRDRDREKVKGIFRFHEIENGQLDFCFRKYQGDKIERYSLKDGQVYEIPLGVAKHLNKNGWYPVHQYYQDETGNAVEKIGQKKSRFSFQSLEFIDLEEESSAAKNKLITVERI